jgi:hypothetical protein
VKLVALWNGLVNYRTVVDLIALENRDLIEIVREHTRADQTGNATADYYRVVSH